MRTLIPVLSTLCLLTVLPFGPPVGPAPREAWTAGILDQVKRAQKLILGERPCGGRMDVKAENWRALATGIDGRVLHASPAGAESVAELRLIRVDPKAVSIRVLVSKDFGREATTAKDFADRSGALAVINAGYYDKKLRPLGLLVAEGKRKKRFVNRRGRQSDALYEGVFLVKGGLPVIQRNEHYRPAGEEVAVQAGPLLIAGGKPASSLRGLRDAKRLDGRTVLSLDGEGRLVIWVTASPLSGMNWCELRDLMVRYGEWDNGPESGKIGIGWALNLDGGASAQLYVRVDSAKGKSLGVQGAPVPVALGFFSRNIER